MSVATAVGLDPVAVLVGLLRHPSPTGDVDAAASALVELTTQAGYRAHRDAAGNVVMRWGDGPAADEILLLGHLDTVPGDIPVREQDGRLHGRGTVDAKGPLAAALAAVSRLDRQRRPVTVVAACDEEGSSLGARLLRSREAPAHLIVLEPSGWDIITTGYRGCVRLGVTLEQASAHHAGPDPGAADRLVAMLAALPSGLGGTAGRAVDRIQVRVNALTTADDGSTDLAFARLELRIPGGTGVDDVVGRVSDMLGDARVSVESACEPVSVSRANDTVRALARAITAAGGRPRYTTKTGTSDLNVVLPAWGCCPAAVYGPGDCSLDHSPNEAIELAELRRGTDVLETTLRALR